MSLRSFLRGFGSVLNIWPSSRTSEKFASKMKARRRDQEGTSLGTDSSRADAEALRGDWQAVGDDMRTAIDKVNKDKSK